VRAAVLSPSGRAAAFFPGPYELGLERLRELGLEPVEYATTRAREPSPAERARDVNAAFADPQIDVVFATIGGDDQLKVLPHLDLEVLRANPKPFFGYSDNTNLHHVLWNLGHVSYYGGAVMVQLGRPGAMHPGTREAIERALFAKGELELREPAEYGDEELDWRDFDASREPPMQPAEAWTWHGPADRVSGRAWGGCLEIVDFQLRAGRWLQPNQAYDGCVLFLETSEELPDAAYVYRVLMAMGERGLLQQFAGVLWGRPKAWSFEHPNAPDEKRRYVDDQRAAVMRALDEYHPGVPLVFGVDFGHTDPQYVIPHGGAVTLDGAERRVLVTY
jgi:muramoyltetrapeptide carboxypeptidase LdcA involved in peptidoglycan recycling